MQDKTKSLNEVYEKDELVYYCNSCGDIIIPGTDPWGYHTPEELPISARELYENYWCEGAGLPMYVVEYKCDKAMAITALFDDGYRDDLLTFDEIAVTSKEFFDAVKKVAIMYCNAFGYETLVGKDTDPIGHEIVFIIPYKNCENAPDIAEFIGGHIYDDFEKVCREIDKNRREKKGRSDNEV